MQVTKFYAILLIGVCALTTAAGQTVTVMQLAPLPETLKESSGLVAHEGFTFWSQNDGGNTAVVQRIDTLGIVVQTLEIDAVNTDWEELTTDSEGNLYIGDFGNNANSRNDLQVLRIAATDLNTSSLVSPSIISFEYGDQAAFPPPANQQHYDCEAMVWWNDTIHLFSKDRSSPHVGITKHYRLPASVGHHVLLPEDTFQTGQLSFIQAITGAALSEDGQKLVLINASSIWIFTDFAHTNFFSGTVQQLQLGSFSQKEAVCFVADDLYFTDEQSVLSVGSLYRVSFEMSVGIEDLIANLELKPVYEQDGTLSALQWNTNEQITHWEMFSMDGRLIKMGTFFAKESRLEASSLTMNVLGHVVIRLSNAEGKMAAILVYIQ